MANEAEGICCLKGEILVENRCVKAKEVDVIDKCYSYDTVN